MAKAKSQKAGTGIPQKHLHSRVSFLSQAATYLASAIEGPRRLQPTAHGGERSNSSSRTQGKEKSTQSQSRHLLSQLRAVSLKSQIRLAPELKHSFCKRCDTLLVPGETSTTRTTNDSRQSQKPWADVLVITCTYCGTARRIPYGQRPNRRTTTQSDEKFKEALSAEKSAGDHNG